MPLVTATLLSVGRITTTLLSAPPTAAGAIPDNAILFIDGAPMTFIDGAPMTFVSA